MVSPFFYSNFAGKIIKYKIMLTLKLITEETDRVIRGLEKKHFKGAREAIDEVLAVDKKRREAQQQLDKNLSEAKKMAAQIGGLMKEGKKAEADAVKAQVSEMKETNKQLEETMNQAQEEMTRLLCQIPNIPYDEVPEGAAAEDNRVVKSNLKECTDKDTVGNWVTVPVSSCWVFPTTTSITSLTVVERML